MYARKFEENINTPLDDLGSRYSLENIRIIWDFDGARELLEFIINNNINFHINIEDDLALERGYHLPIYIPDDLIYIFQLNYPELEVFTKSSEFFKFFWQIVRDLSFSDILNNDIHQRYFIITNEKSYITMNTFTEMPTSNSRTVITDRDSLTDCFLNDIEIGAISQELLNYTNFYDLLKRLSDEIVLKLLNHIENDKIPDILSAEPINFRKIDSSVFFSNVNKHFNVMYSIDYIKFIKKINSFLPKYTVVEG